MPHLTKPNLAGYRRMGAEPRARTTVGRLPWVGPTTRIENRGRGVGGWRPSREDAILPVHTHPYYVPRET